MHHQEWSCSSQKLDTTDTERRLMGELGWLVWHSVANGGSGIEVDDESHSRQKGAGPPLPRIVDERTEDARG